MLISKDKFAEPCPKIIGSDKTVAYTKIAVNKNKIIVIAIEIKQTDNKKVPISVASRPSNIRRVNKPPPNNPQHKRRQPKVLIPQRYNIKP